MRRVEDLAEIEISQEEIVSRRQNVQIKYPPKLKDLFEGINRISHPHPPTSLLETTKRPDPQAGCQLLGSQVMSQSAVSVIP